jgi:dipeptidyl aminopeptidase/acylaminoacyl peptidase
VAAANTLPYGGWPSPLRAADVAAAQVGLAAPLLTPTHAWWCEGRPTEGGRVALVREARDGRREEVTPQGFNLRTRVHEYGGRSYAVDGDLVVGVDFADQRLWRLAPGAAPEPLTPESGGRLRYADLLIDAGRRRVLAVREDHRGAGEPANTLVALPLAGDPDEGRVLAAGHDFVAAPTLSGDRSRLAWLSWDHPHMPWDGTTLWVAALDADGLPAEPERVAGGADESVVQPLWLADGSLVFASDRSGFWNLWRWGGRDCRPLCPMDGEFAGPLWALGTRWFAALDATTLAVTVAQDGFVRLGRLEAAGGPLELLDLPFAEVGEPSCAGGRILVAAAATDAAPAIVLVDAATGVPTVLRRAGELPVAAAWLSPPRSLRFASVGGREVQAFYYPPTNPTCHGPPGERPPLLLRSHGGPTSRSGAGLGLAIQFWTSRGFAVADVNYSGSTGFGRAYRRRLDGQWGLVDVEDCIACARALVAQGLADPERLLIRGGSASGYTTLCALTFHDVFRAGASYYGIGDLEALARDTHKFESRYLDRLVGPWPERADLYRARSPIHHVDRLRCPAIFLQGLDDKVVPPSQAEAMVAALRERGLPVAYLAFAGEGHGFRRAETIAAALLAEHAFLCRVLGITPAEGTAPLEIANLPA